MHGMGREEKIGWVERGVKVDLIKEEHGGAQRRQEDDRGKGILSQRPLGEKGCQGESRTHTDLTRLCTNTGKASNAHTQSSCQKSVRLAASLHTHTWVKTELGPAVVHTHAHMHCIREDMPAGCGFIHSAVIRSLHPFMCSKSVWERECVFCVYTCSYTHTHTHTMHTETYPQSLSLLHTHTVWAAGPWKQPNCQWLLRAHARSFFSCCQGRRRRRRRRGRRRRSEATRNRLKHTDRKEEERDLDQPLTAYLSPLAGWLCGRLEAAYKWCLAHCGSALSCFPSTGPL